jgi:hypothetical protein
MEFDQIEPIGDRRSDIRAGLICATFANVTSGVRGGSTDWSPADFMLFGKSNTYQPAEAESASDAILEQDPEVHSALIKAAIFGIKPGK